MGPNRDRGWSMVPPSALETTDVPPVYPFTGDEHYARAKVISSKAKADPFQEGDLEMAWTQPVVLGGGLGVRWLVWT